MVSTDPDTNVSECICVYQVRISVYQRGELLIHADTHWYIRQIPDSASNPTDTYQYADTFTWYLADMRADTCVSVLYADTRTRMYQRVYQRVDALM